MAIHTLAGLLPPNARTDAALLRMLRTTDTLPESEKQILAMLFGPVRTVHVRELLERVLRRCDEGFPPPNRARLRYWNCLKSSRAAATGEALGALLSG